ncbi:MAG: hypothetical protein ACRCX7_04265 [Cetobacterium sp.]|uniref:hypothetical protein n=1 Tax=Cetobacterium sp. TaxID=2071632 RepID=UPI003F309A5E
MKKIINILLIPCIILFGSEIFIEILFSILKTFSLRTEIIEMLNIKIIILAIMIFINNIIKEYKSKKEF